MTRRSSTASLIFAWTMLAAVLGLCTWLVLSPLLSSSRPTEADLARGEVLIRTRYANSTTRVGHVSLAPAGRCAMHGSAVLVDLETGAARKADCLVTIGATDTFSAVCR